MTDNNDDPIYSVLNGKAAYTWSGFNGETDYNGNPLPQSLAFSVAGTFDGVDYYSTSFNVQTGPEAYMISTIGSIMYRRTSDTVNNDGEPYGMWEIVQGYTSFSGPYEPIPNQAGGSYGPPLSYIFWSGTPPSTPPLSGWTNGSLA
jgi:hypothetical protein